MTHYRYPSTEEVRALERAARYRRARALGRMFASAVRGLRRAYAVRRRGVVPQ